MLTQHRQEVCPVPSPARPGHLVRGTSHQLALPLPPGGPPAGEPAAIPPLTSVVPVRPRQVWGRLPPPVQAEVRRTVWRVLEEVIRHEPRR
jgi:hypothetical protein